MLAYLLLRVVWDVDIFWQLKLGELIIARGGPLRQEPFAATHLGQPLPAFAWLAQVIMAEIRRLFGWTGLQVFDAVCWLGGFLVVALACRRRSGSAAGVLLALAIAFLTAVSQASIRPQTFAVLCFGLLLALLRLRLKPWRTALIAVPLLLLWQNLHPSVSVAAIALAVSASLDWRTWFLGQGAPPWEKSFLVVMAGGAMFATPDGWSILAVAGVNAQFSAALGVSEWLPLWAPINRYGAVSILLVAVVVTWLVLRDPQRVDLGELALAIVFFVMTVCVMRFVLFWALTLIPVVARAVAPPPVERRLPRAIAPLALLVVAIAVPLLRPTQFSTALPLAAIERLHATGIRGTIFAHFPWGGPVIDMGYPDWRVAYDGRYYRYSREEWDFYNRIGWNKVPLAEIERRYHPVGYLLDREWNHSLIAELRRDARWQELPSDGVAVVFKRKSGATP